MNAGHIWNIEKVQSNHPSFCSACHFFITISISSTTKWNVFQLIKPQMIISQSNTSLLNILWQIKYQLFNHQLWTKLPKFGQLDICKESVEWYQKMHQYALHFSCIVKSIEWDYSFSIFLGYVHYCIWHDEAMGIIYNIYLSINLVWCLDHIRYCKWYYFKISHRRRNENVQP